MSSRKLGRASFDHCKSVREFFRSRSREDELLVCPDADKWATCTGGNKARDEENSDLAFGELVLFTI
jgi:hypothetical protein